jgi:hypothetical protein
MGALNDYCFDNDFSLAETGLVARDEADFTSPRFGTLPRQEVEVWKFSATHKTSAERSAISALCMAAYGVASLLWTPPGEGSDRRFRVVAGTYKDIAVSAQDWKIEFSLRFLPGIV